MDKILLIDANNYIYRGVISFGKPQTEPSYTIVYNFFRNLRATIEQFQPTKVFFCLEGKNCFRYKLYPEYKANRIVKLSSEKAAKKAEDFNRQAGIITELLSNLPITIVKSDGFECDDVIATLVENLKDEDTTIISTDTDFIQLLQKDYKNTKIYDPRKKDYMQSPLFHYLTWKILRGDKSTDNIPGIISDAKAEAIASNIDDLAAFLDASEENRANYALNKELIELRIIKDDDLQFIDYNVSFENLKSEFERMDFKSMLEDKYWNRFVDTFKSLR